ncbi:MAG: metallophosphoesterase [Terracidiphilus sp.]|jgi:sphingomyelin phosphodiesterase acid-like 3
MKRSLAARILRAVAMQTIAALLFASAALAQSGQPAAARPAPAAQQAKATVPALLVSDIHFEPFWDPAKAPQLASAPVSEWKAILAAAPSPDQQQRFQSLQQGCHARGADTSFALFDSSLKAMRSHAIGAKFVAVSGDLISHAFDCKYNTLFPKSTPEAYRTFVEKTLDYVMGELYGEFPGVPIYAAMGNNDSDCGDYRLDTHSDFLATVGKEVTQEFPGSERQGALDTFAVGGYYSVSLPAPIQNARLLVLNDIFMSKNYTTCAGKADQGAAAAQLAWLTQQLAEARASKQKVWVMGHIPPGVDLYSTARRMTNVCGGQEPVMFLSSEKMADVLVDSADVVELAIFAHTHMDEMRLLKSESQKPDSARTVAVKMVSSISPINGNKPSFTVAQIDPASAALMDYKVFEASNQTSINATWQEEYDYARSYHKAEFNSSSVSQLIAEFAADPTAKTLPSQKYIEDFSVGYASPLLTLVWPEYVCAMSNHTEQEFRTCVCPAAQ